MADLRAPVLEPDVPLAAATLRYFDPQGSFAAAVGASGAPGVRLVRVRPTETLALCEEGAQLAQLAQRLATIPGGHVVDLSGGLKALRLRGAGAADLMRRLGGHGTMPPFGEARRGRLADVSVLVLSVRIDELLLVVDRAYAAHLEEWIRATLADWKGE